MAHVGRLISFASGRTPSVDPPFMVICRILYLIVLHTPQSFLPCPAFSLPTLGHPCSAPSSSPASDDFTGDPVWCEEDNEVEGTAAEGSHSLEAEFVPVAGGGSYGAVQR
jgi:hypothetical protein